MTLKVNMEIAASSTILLLYDATSNIKTVMYTKTLWIC